MAFPDQELPAINNFEIPRFSGDNKQVYLQLLGSEGDHLPNMGEFPDVINLPAEALGDVWQGLTETQQDGLERGGEVDWNEAGHFFATVRKRLGTKTSIKLPMTAIYFGKKPLLQWHTHPDQIGEAAAGGIRYLKTIFSYPDLKTILLWQRASYIAGVMSSDGGMFVCQSAEAAKQPLSSVLRAKRHIKQVLAVEAASYNQQLQEAWKHYQLHPNQLQPPKLRDKQTDVIVTTLHAAGYESYVWFPKDKQPDGSLILRKYSAIRDDYGKTVNSF